MLVERWIEGDRNARIRLDKAPWTAGRSAQARAKHAVWLLIAFATGGAWIIYFADAPTRRRAILHRRRPALGVYFFVGLFTATTYLLAGLAREQVCTYMCPWPRIQGAMLDEDTLLVTYDAWRGEPRGKHKKGDSWEGRGDCIDCKPCVAVCPTGIDIRDGLQLECIGCGLCIDACNDVMDKIGRPRELIAYDTRAQPGSRARRRASRRRYRLRPAAHDALRRRCSLVVGRRHAGRPLLRSHRRRQHPARPQPAVRHPVRRQHPQRLHHQDPEQGARDRARTALALAGIDRPGCQVGGRRRHERDARRAAGTGSARYQVFVRCRASA